MYKTELQQQIRGKKFETIFKECNNIQLKQAKLRFAQCILNSGCTYRTVVDKSKNEEQLMIP